MLKASSDYDETSFQCHQTREVIIFNSGRGYVGMGFGYGMGFFEYLGIGFEYKSLNL